MEALRRIHPGYAGVESAQKKGLAVRQMFGKYQYIYKSEKGKISLINLPKYLNDGKNSWEIYCLENKLFEDTEAFATKKDAVKRVKKLLE